MRAKGSFVGGLDWAPPGLLLLLLSAVCRPRMRMVGNECMHAGRLRSGLCPSPSLPTKVKFQNGTEHEGLSASLLIKI